MMLGSLQTILHTQRLTGGKFSERGGFYVQKDVGYRLYKGDPSYNVAHDSWKNNPQVQT